MLQKCQQWRLHCSKAALPEWTGGSSEVSAGVVGAAVVVVAPNNVAPCSPVYGMLGKWRPLAAHR